MIIIFLVFRAGNIEGQIVTTKNDTLRLYNDTLLLKVNEFRGEIRWQYSNDFIYWADIAGNYNNTLLLESTDSTCWYRAKIIEGLCSPVYSDTVYVQLTTPVIETLPVTSVGSNSVRLLGEIIDDGGTEIIEKGFYWSSTDQTPDAGDKKEVVSGTTSSYNKNITGLSPNTSYYFVAFATNSEGISTGIVYSFKTDQLSPPIVQTDAASDVDENSATLNGNVTSDGNGIITERGFYWSSTDQTPDKDDNKEVVSGTIGNYNKNITGLPEDITYYFVAFATNSKGTSTGSVQSFKTYQYKASPASTPTVQTDSASDITTNSAKLNGNVTSDGDATITERGFYWSSTDQTPDADDNKEVVSGTTGIYSKNIKGLTANTSYYVVAFATNSKGTSTGYPQSFKTEHDLPIPTVQTYIASEITLNSATLNGNVTSEGDATINERGFYWILTDQISGGRYNKETVPGAVGSFSKNIAGLNPNTSYSFAAFATNSEGTSTGSTQIFKTYPKVKAPTVRTDTASNVAANSAILNGNVTSDGDTLIIERGFYWSSVNKIPDAGDNKEIVSGTTGSFSHNITSLIANTTYYFVAFATNSEGTSTGDTQSFKTDQLSLPAVQTEAVSDVDENSATLNGNVTSDGYGTITERGFYWSSTDQTPDNSDNKEVVSGSVGNFSKNITGLIPNTIYYFVAFATNSAWTAKGSAQSFKTDPKFELPTVQTNTVSDITTNSATLNGNVISDGDTAITERGFYWSTTDQTPDAGDNKEVVSGTTGSYNNNITGLTSNTSYYFVAFATNSEGTSTGTVQDFVTNHYDSESGTFTDSRDGHEYKWVKIGDQIWMAENLAYLPSVCSPNLSDCESYVDPHYYVYDYYGTNVAEAKVTDNYENYGVLYNWPAAMIACPEGWHLPTDDEWKQLEMYIGMSQSAVDSRGWRGPGISTKLKATSGWDYIYGNGTDEYGFTALPAGFLNYGDWFIDKGELLLIWCASDESCTEYEDTNWAFYRKIYGQNSTVYRSCELKLFGVSVRCVKD